MRGYSHAERLSIDYEAYPVSILVELICVADPQVPNRFALLELHRAEVDVDRMTIAEE
jgi:hypothetical protein